MVTQTHIEIIVNLLDQGELTPSKLVEVASDKKSPLHDLFEWDDAAAAHKHRLWQARRLIKRVNVYIEDPEDKIVHVPCIERSNAEGVYRRLSKVVDDDIDFDLAFDDALRRLKSAKHEVDILLAAVNNKRTKNYKKVVTARDKIEEAISIISSLQLT